MARAVLRPGRPEDSPGAVGERLLGLVHAPAGSGLRFVPGPDWALEKGLTDSFDADTPATRAATVTYLWKLAGAPAADSAAFTDVAADATYASAVAWAVKEGITAGTSASTFSPDNTCTRGQIVTFLYRDAFGESTGENSSSNNQTVTPNAGGNSYEQDISALMAEGYTQEEAHKILELMAGGYSEDYIKETLKKLTGLGAKTAVLTGVSFKRSKYLLSLDS